MSFPPVIKRLNELDIALGANGTALTTHANNKNNPHAVTAAQIGAYLKGETYSAAEINNLLAEFDTGGGFTNKELITTSGNWTAPRSGVYIFTVVGAGGGGTGSWGLIARAGASGGGGAAFSFLMYLNEGQVVVNTIGAGGNGGPGATSGLTAPATGGMPGGNTFITINGKIIVAAGGGGGALPGGDTSLVSAAGGGGVHIISRSVITTATNVTAASAGPMGGGGVFIPGAKGGTEDPYTLGNRGMHLLEVPDGVGGKTLGGASMAIIDGVHYGKGGDGGAATAANTAGNAGQAGVSGCVLINY